MLNSVPCQDLPNPRQASIISKAEPCLPRCPREVKGLWKPTILPVHIFSASSQKRQHLWALVAHGAQSRGPRPGFLLAIMEATQHVELFQSRQLSCPMLWRGRLALPLGRAHRLSKGNRSLAGSSSTPTQSRCSPDSYPTFNSHN